MSKKAIALVLTAVFVFAFATSAFGAWGDSSYMNPALLGAGGTGTTSPHGPYDTTSKKCAVCHAVHNADAAGAQLLRGGANDPCVTCHVATDAGVKVVYNGQTTAWTVDSAYAHNKNVNGLQCGSCHTVHGAGAVSITGVAYLKAQPAYADGQGTASATRLAADYAGMTTATVVGSTDNLTDWCSGCHPYETSAYNKKSHVMKAPTATYDNTSSTVNVPVAFATSADCKSCHSDTVKGDMVVRDATDIVGAAFPHYTDGARFLTSSTGSGNATTAPSDPSIDGVCLKCHVNGTATSGVGKTF